MIKNRHTFSTACLREAFIIVLFASLVFLVYSNTLNVPFIFDDLPHIPENHHIRITDLTWNEVKDAAFESPAVNRPLANLTFGLNYYFHQYDVTGYHVVNIIIHIITGILLFFFIRTTVKLATGNINVSRETGKPKVPESRGKSRLDYSVIIAFCAAFIWLVHPLHTQSVTYIVQRMNSMAAMFYMASFLLYVRGRLVEKKAMKALFFAGCIITALLSLGSKEIAVTLPFFIALYEWYFFQDLDTSWAKRRVLLIAGVFLFITIAAFLYMGADPIERIFSGYDMRDFTLSQRIMTEFRVVILYLSLLFFPHYSRLNLDYDFPLSYSLFNPATTILSLAIIIGLIILALYLAKRERLISFCILWFFGTLIIESSIIPLELVYEHRTYLPSMMASLVFVVLAYRYITYRWVRIALLSFVIAVFSLWTYERNTIWTDELTLWQDVMKKSPGKARPHYNYGLVLAKQNKIDNAIHQYKEALRINPNYSRAHNNLGIALVDKGDYGQAVDHFNEALRIEPINAKAHNNLGIVLSRQGKTDEALSHYYRALKIDPKYIEVRINIGVALVKQGKYAEAIDHYTAVLQKNPASVKALVNLGVAHTRSGKPDEAIAYLLKALKFKPGNSDAHNSLGVALAAQGKNNEAIFHYRKALKIKPVHAETNYNLAIALAKSGMLDEAIKYYEIALKIRPNYPDAHNNLGVALIRKGKIDEAIGHFRRAITIGSASISSRDNLQNVLQTQMSMEVAIADIQRKIDEDPGNDALHNKLTDLYDIKGKIDGATDQMGKVPEIQPEYAQALNNVAIAYTIKGEYEKAFTMLKRIIEFQPGNAVPYYNIACIFAKQNKADESVDWLNKAVERGFNQWDYLKTDPDLENIRGSLLYKDFIKNH